MKKHKAWAQCSGIRNPAEYRKRNDLATDSSIDKDFNFITSVERAITRADENVLDRKIHLAPARQLGLRDARAKVEIEIENRGVKVIRAPKGLSRSKNNKTHWASQHKGIMWTMEWVCPDGEKVIGSALETRTIEEAFVNTVGKKRVRGKRKLSVDKNMEESNKMKKSVRQDEKSTRPDLTQNAQIVLDVTVNTNDNDETAHLPTKINPVAGLKFYLHKPNTPSKFKCLIPLPSEQTLRSALEGRAVLEFPTIFIMHGNSGTLPSPFITETEYLGRYGEDVVANGSSTVEEGEIGTSVGPTLPSSMDTGKVMEVLAKDLSA